LPQQVFAGKLHVIDNVA